VKKAKDEFQADLDAKRVGREDALFEYRMGKEISVFQGCGLGGTSLINANVSLRPDPRLFEDERWPEAIRGDLEGGVEAGFRRAEEMLRPVPYPATTQPSLVKFDALRASAKAMGKESSVGRPPINVNFEKGVNHVGIHQEACNGCGDCASGCNVGAKNTLMMNYLPDARRHGAEIFTGGAARRVEKAGEEWRVWYRPVGGGRDAFEAADLFVTAGVVVVAAGTLGTAEILLRSKHHGLSCSEQLGKRFTGNGDVLGFGYNMDRRVHGIGMAKRDVDPDEPVGPCISGIIDLRASASDPEDGFVIEEGVIPGALAPVLPSSLKAAAKLIGKDTDRGFGDWLREKLRAWTSVLFGAYRGATANTQTYLIMANDDAGGTLEFADDRVSVRWPNVGKAPLFKKLNGALEDATRAHGGTYIPSPLYNRAFGFDLLTVHPLGGCPMGDDAARGAVDHKGRLFAGRAGNAVHEGLYVTDGAVMPRSLGVNPLLTISAIAERSVRLLAEERGWSVENGRPGEGEVVSGKPGAGGTELRFTERMAGHCSTGTLEDPVAAEEAGREEDSPCAFVLTIHTADLDRMVEDEKHEAGMFGTVTAPALSSEAMTVHGGKFRLFEDVTGPNGPMKRMLYRMDLASVEGGRFHFEGEKHIRNDEGLDVWEDTTTLFITIREGGSDGEVKARGVLRIKPEDFTKQLGTMQAFEPDGSSSLAGQARFGKFFAGALWETYGPEGLRSLAR